MTVSNSAKLAAGSGVIFLLGLAALYGTISDSIQLIHAIQHKAIRIDFQKGDYYIFGGGLIMTVFPLIFLVMWLTKSNPGPKGTKIMLRSMATFLAVCLLSIPVLPQALSISVGHYLEKRDYTYCSNLSRQWLFDKTMVYQKQSCQAINKSDTQ